MSDSGDHLLWYTEPAKTWVEALPLGNGVLGVMVQGGAPREIFHLNDGRAWSGSPASETAEPQIDPEMAASAISEARAAIVAHDYETADSALKKLQHRYSQTYLPFADLQLEIDPDESGTVSDYRRSLDLRTATHETRYRLGGSLVVQRSYVSAASGVLVVEIESDSPVEIRLTQSSQLRVLGEESDLGSASLLLKMPADVTPSHDSFENPLHYSDDDSLSEQGVSVMTWSHDGEPRLVPHGLMASRVKRATVYLTTQTTFVSVGREPDGTALDALDAARKRLDLALNRGSAEIRRQHLNDHSELYSRVIAHTGPDIPLPTGRRLLLANDNPEGALATDPALAGLLFNYGRYLLISSSREAGVAANLQGIWNNQLQPPWSSNYTTNINLQMNYWMAETANLPECLPPLFDLIDALAITGSRTARRLYGAPGWVAHHNTDVWAYSQPVGLGSHDPKWAFWPMAGAWLVRHLWEHILHGADDSFARDRAFAPIRGAAEFFLAWLVELPDGSLGTSPSTSPENQFRTPDGVVGSAATSSAFDLVVIADLFDMLAALADRLEIVDDVVDRAKLARARIPDPRIGSDGTIREWADEFEFPDPHHRHIAHLYFVYPSDRPLTPELAAAASRSLDSRGDESTGWSLAWKLAIRARLGESKNVGRLLALVFRDMAVDRGPWIGGLYPNLFAAHPPFQIDGNLGFVAGLAECVVQSHRGAIELLRSVPREIASGSISGLVARPGVTVSISWKPDSDGNASLENVSLAALRSSARRTHLVRYGDSSVEIDLSGGAVVTLVASDFADIRVTFPTA